MTSKCDADNVFGQVLICLRMSKLDYLVKETPYAVRKKFSKAHHIKKDTVVDSVATSVENEKNVLKDEIKDLKTAIALATVEYEELEIQNESMKRDMANLDDKLEEAYLETRNFKAELCEINIEKTC